MTARVDCFLGSFRKGLTLPPFPVTLGPVPIERYLERAARAGDNDYLSLRMDATRSSLSERASNEITDIPALEAALDDLILGQPGPRLPRRVGLIFADRYHYKPSLLGLMFDVAPFADGAQREGCAVFLDAIRKFRAAEGPEAQTVEVSFTALHELGHCFNLWHAEEPQFAPNLMTTSDKQVFGDNAWFFIDDHENYLRLADGEESRFVLPGGSNFDVRPNGWYQGGGDHQGTRNDPRRPRRTNLALHVRPDRGEMWHFEPLELEVRLAVVGAGSVRRVPDELDPGYDRFRIWIEEPSGRRRLYRPPVRYCTNAASLAIQPRQPFRRDITLFAGAGGYTFRTPGEHRLQVSFQVSEREVLWSNVAPLYLRPARPGLREFDAMEEVLTRPRVGKLLFERSARLKSADMGAVQSLARRYAKSPTVAALKFAVGGWMAQRSRYPTRTTKDERTVMRDQARRLLMAAADHHGLGRHRKRRVAQLLDELHTPPVRRGAPPAKAVD